MPNDELVTYDEVNKVLLTVPESFAARDKDVVSIIWNANIQSGMVAGPGMSLAQVQWDDNSMEPVAAPSNCSGEISWVNRDITFETLSFPPPQFLLKFREESH